MDWQKGKDCEIYEKYLVENRLFVVSTGMNVIVWRKHPWQISFHDFEMQDAGYKAMSVPISGCDFMFEFGYVKMEGEPLSDITQEFIKNVKARLN